MTDSGTAFTRILSSSFLSFRRLVGPCSPEGINSPNVRVSVRRLSGRPSVRRRGVGLISASSVTIFAAATSPLPRTHSLRVAEERLLASTKVDENGASRKRRFPLLSSPRQSPCLPFLLPAKSVIYTENTDRESKFIQKKSVVSMLK